jgi:RimJ/RimL family protein N-acetyltransferase
MKISFREIEPHDAKMILDWRTSPQVTQYMITDVSYDLEAQKKWILDCYAMKDYYHWIILCDHVPIGCIYMRNFDFENARTSWGFYKGVAGFPGIGSKILPFFYNWLFLKIGIKNIFTEVFYNNIKVIELYLGYGHKFLPAQDRVIHKNGREILLIALSLTWQDWDTGKYKDSLAPIPTSHWKYSPCELFS